MASEETEAAESPPPRKRWPLWLLAGLVVGALGGGGFVASRSLLGGEEPPSDVSEPLEEGESPSEEDLAARLVQLDPFVVNLGGGTSARYLKVGMEIELTATEARALVEQAMPRVRDAVIVLLSSQRQVDLQEFEGKILLKEELADRLNATLARPVVRAVLFTEFVVQ